MKQEDRAKIKLLWGQVQDTMDRIERLGYTPEEIEADIEDAIRAVREDEMET